ncbi:MAG: hypothetical protein L3J63_00400 [Geopsychrobacter sp.]|nr:hypothetical protein [Geopsychrobacter sp.]
MFVLRRFSILFLLILLLQGCSSDESGIEGALLFNQQPLGQSRVEFYLKSGTERSSSPFSVATTDLKGEFHAVLPPGNYYLVAKKKEQGGGVNRMLMAEYPLNPVRVEKGFSQIEPLQVREVGFEGAIHSDGKTLAQGQLSLAGSAVADAFVYVYSQGEGLTGPAYGLVVQADEQGHFELALSAGRYWLAARKRSDGSRAGDPKPGDLNGEYPGNPIILKAGEQLKLLDWNLKPITAAGRDRRLSKGKFTQTSTWLSGKVVDEEHRPVTGIYLFAYRDNRMIGKPNFISAPTDKNGEFKIYLEDGGEFFVGARSTFGGPLEPGEWVGTYDGRPDHGIDVVPKRATELGDILVREVW